jgi:transcriptional regulator with XRE-family HTH domain
MNMQKIDLIEIGVRIRTQREMLGYTRDYLAEQLDKTPKFIRDIEIGAKGMSIQTLIGISNTLKLTTDYILFGSQTKNNIDPIVHMLNTCSPEKLKYAENILKSFILSIE